MGKQAFKLLAQDELLKSLPWILEVPGIDGKSGPDKETIDNIKKITSA